jgi:hypothetical protein
MPQISLTQFIEFAAAQGTARIATVASTKQDYEPRKDFYKQLRERVVSQFVTGWNVRELLKALEPVTTQRKENSYEACAGGLHSWARGKAISARKAPNKIWSANGLDVKVNPELRMVVDGERYLVRLYFKADELTAARRDMMLFLLSTAAPNGVEPAILDSQRGQLITAHELDPNLGALLASEAAAFTSLY